MIDAVCPRVLESASLYVDFTVISDDQINDETGRGIAFLLRRFERDREIGGAIAERIERTREHG